MAGKKQPRVLVASSLWWPLSARLAARFIHHGCNVSAICPSGHVLGHLPGLRRLYDYRVLDSRAALEEAIGAVEPDLVVPCDDRVAWQLHELHALRPGLRALVEGSVGQASEFEIVSRRERLLETAAALGVPVPETRTVRSEDDVRAWFANGPRRSVLKLDGTWGGSGVQIVDSEGAALRSLGALRRPAGVTVTVKRLLVNRDPLATWAWRRGGEPSITIQRFIEGRPANAMMACWRGEVLATVAVEVLASQGATGAGIVVRVVANPVISRTARVLAQRLGLSGFYGLDFIIDGATGESHLLEMNPRCTQLGHLVLPGQGDLVGVLCAKLGAPAPAEPSTAIEGGVVAFFPQSLLAEPRSRYAEGAHLDVPWEHASLVRELLRPSFPERGWIARLYHQFRPPRPTPTIEFDEPAAPTAAERGRSHRS